MIVVTTVGRVPDGIRRPPTDLGAAHPTARRTWSARNAGGPPVALAAFIDDDCVPAPDWLSAFSGCSTTVTAGCSAAAWRTRWWAMRTPDASERISHFVYERSRTNGAREPLPPTTSRCGRTYFTHSADHHHDPGDTAEDKEF